MILVLGIDPYLTIGCEYADILALSPVVSIIKPVADDKLVGNEQSHIANFRITLETIQASFPPF